MIVGNSLTSYNSFVEKFNTKIEGINPKINVDTMLADGSSISINIASALFKKKLSFEQGNLKEDFKFWLPKNSMYNEFLNLINSYDIIYLQNNDLDCCNFSEIINVIMKNIKPGKILLIYENFSKITWNNKIREKEYKKNYKKFKRSIRFNDYKNLKLIPIGTLYNKFYTDGTLSKYIFSDFHPTSYGTELLCKLILHETINHYGNNNIEKE